MRYRVAEVLEVASDDDLPAFAIPTVLDGELNSHFFPSPKNANYGRTMNLEPDENCQRLVSEILHRRIDYRPEHLDRFGWISKPLPPCFAGDAFARRRDEHLFCLRYESDRNNFGDNILKPQSHE